MSHRPTLRTLLAFAAVFAIGATIFLILQQQGDVPTPAILDGNNAIAMAPTDATVVAPGGGPANELAASAAARTEVDASDSDDPLLDPAIRAALCGFRGRIVDESAAPVPDCDVELVRFGVETMFGGDPSTMAEDGLDSNLDPPLELAFKVGATTTAADGRFELNGVWPQAFYMARFNANDALCSTMIVDQTPGPGEVVDLGDIVIERTATVIGRVVNDEGEPIAGAIVRAADIPGATSAFFPFERIDPKGTLIVCDSSFQQVFEMPSWVERAFDLLPIAQTVTGADGRFRLVGIVAGDNILTASAPRRLALLQPRLPLKAGDEHDTGDLCLRAGEEAWGKVVDEIGNPIAGAEVLVGQVLGMAPIAFAGRTDPTSDSGEFSLEGFRNGKVVAAARRRAGDAWVVSETGPIVRDLIVRLPSEFQLTLAMVGPANQPVTDAEFRLFPGALDEGMGPLARFGVAKPASIEARTRRDEEGNYIIDHLPAGEYRIEAVAPGCAVTADTITLTADLRRTLALDSAASGKVIVVDDAGEPIRSVAVYRSSDDDDEMPSFCGRTNRKGTLELRRAAPGETTIFASHPAYGNVSETTTLPTEEVRLVLHTPGTLAGVLAIEGKPPEIGTYMIVVTNGSGSDDMLPRLTTPDAEGAFTVIGLQPGEYNVIATPSLRSVRSFSSVFRMVHESFLFGEGSTAMEECSVRSGEVTEIELGVVAEQEIEGPSGTVTGMVLINGKPGASMVVRAGWGGHSATVDASGRFDLGRVEVGHTTVQLYDSSDNTSVFEPIWSGNFDVAENRNVEVFIDFSTGSVAGRVLAPDGSPAARAQLRLEGSTQRSGSGPAGQSEKVGSSDDAGVFRMDGVPAGTYVLRAASDGGRGALEGIEVHAGTTPTQVTVQVMRTYEVAGSVEASSFTDPAPSWCWIRLVPAEGSTALSDEPSDWIDLDDRSFALDGVPAGRYRLLITAYREESGEEGSNETEYRHAEIIEVRGDVTGLILRPVAIESQPEKTGTVIEGSTGR